MSVDIVANNHPLVNYKCQGHPNPSVHCRFSFSKKKNKQHKQILPGLGQSGIQDSFILQGVLPLLLPSPMEINKIGIFLKGWDHLKSSGPIIALLQVAIGNTSS